MFSRRILIRAFLCSLLALFPLPEQENKIYDQKLQLLSRLFPQKNESVVLLELNKDDFEFVLREISAKRKLPEASAVGTVYEKFESLRRQYFWNDAFYEQLLTRLLREDPRAVLISIFYDESYVHLQSNGVLQRLAKNPKILWASSFDADQKLNKPSSELVGDGNYGFINLYPDSDSIVRRAYLANNEYPSLPYRALQDKDTEADTKKSLTTPFLIQFAGKAGSIPTCHLHALFTETQGCGPLKDKFLILSPAQNSPAGGSFQTPVGPLSRAEILGNILNTAKNHSAPVPLPWWLLFIFIFLHVMLLGYAMLNFSTSLQVASAALLLCFEVMLSLWLQGFAKMQLPLMSFVTATIAAYIVFLWWKFSYQENKRWQAEKKAQYLHELDELKSNFMSLMSHDLKTPIAKIQALTERLTREARSLSPEQKENLDAIRRSNDELSAYILSILNFQKIESQEVILNSKSHDINALIEEVITRMQTLADDRKIRIEKNLEPLFPTEFDEHLIRQVLTNLIDNAIKYNAEGTVVQLHSFEQENSLCVSVEDNGAGIPEEQQGRLFKKFSRSEKGTAERVKGTGLGLYLCKYFIELHGGKISVSSKPGQGTKFQFTLPIS